MTSTRRPLGRTTVAVAAALGLALTAACTTSPTPDSGTTSTTTGTGADASEAPPQSATLATPPAATTLDATDEALTALAVSQTLFASAPVAVLAPAGDIPAQLTAASAAVAVGAPVLLVDGTVTDGQVDGELDRLGTTYVLAVGDARAPASGSVQTVAIASGADAADLAAATGRTYADGDPVADGTAVARVDGLVHPRTTVLTSDGAAVPSAASPSADAPSAAAPTDDATTAPVAAPVLSPRATTPRATPSAGDDEATADEADGEGDPEILPTVEPPPALSGALLLDQPGSGALAAHATARAAGLTVVEVPGGDPRADGAVVEAVAAAVPTAVVALGVQFGPPDLVAARVATAATGAQLPGGGQLVFTDGTDGQSRAKRYVALYGTPGTPALGVLGEQDVPATLARAAEHAGWYAPLTTDQVVPMVEIIATIASAGPGPDGNYSDERPVDALRPLVDAAGQAGVAVVLDLQPGRTDFLTQAQQYEELLALPHVGLALDPEWRLAPDQVHLRQIGSVGIDEVNATAAWLAQLTRERHLPQKMFVVHQFASRMVSDRARLDVSHDELAVLIHVDGQGTQPAKAGTWNALRTDAPPVHWGWKNFYDEDLPMLDPTQTYQVQPLPDLVTYQ
ncbi:hypothetical protein ACTHAM_003280 [Cellulomonas soli]|uniref:hypothetical protein n=1 Tax=Cellulomonas soli TaxID=931535 RepID=UPI003F8480B1